jgi:hypothetical protein
VDSLTQPIDSLLHVLIQLSGRIVLGIVAVELWLRTQLTHYGVTPTLQTVLLLGLTGLLISVSVRVFGGLTRIAFILIVVLIAFHIVTEALQT